ncbi:MAG: hypothetical protein KDE53_32920, partial [Caldilineaceae bacterium]|nr:hypothetical protein [Caldilineaceae bacterium]
MFGLTNPDQRDAIAPPVTYWFQVARCHFMRRLTEYEEARQQLEALLATLLPVSADGVVENSVVENSVVENSVVENSVVENSVVENSVGEKGLSATDEELKPAQQACTFALCVLGWINYEQGQYESA